MFRFLPLPLPFAFFFFGCWGSIISSKKMLVFIFLKWYILYFFSKHRYANGTYLMKTFKMTWWNLLGTWKCSCDLLNCFLADEVKDLMLQFFIAFYADETRVKEFGLKSMWRSPNGTIRNILNGLLCSFFSYIFFIFIFIYFLRWFSHFLYCKRYMVSLLFVI